MNYAKRSIWVFLIIGAMGAFLWCVGLPPFHSAPRGDKAVVAIHVLDRPVPLWHSAHEGLTQFDLCRVSSFSYKNGHLLITLAPPEDVFGETLFNSIDIDTVSGRASCDFFGSHRQKIMRGVVGRETLRIETAHVFVWGGVDGINRVSIIFDVPHEGEDLKNPNFVRRYLINIELPVRLIGFELPDISERNVSKSVRDGIQP